MSPRKPPDPVTLSHVDRHGEARMVDVSGKASSLRRARAAGLVRMRAETRAAIAGGAAAKGDVLAAARIAGILAAKRTGELIPLCHPLALESVRVDFFWLDPDDRGDERLQIEAEAVVSARTGVEMEALTAVCVAALTIYDMAKAIDRGMTIDDVRLVEKTGGKSGHWVRDKRA